MTRISQNRKIYPKIVGAFRLTHLPSYEPPFFNDNTNGNGGWTPPVPPAPRFLRADNTNIILQNDDGTQLKADGST